MPKCHKNSHTTSQLRSAELLKIIKWKKVLSSKKKLYLAYKMCKTLSLLQVDHEYKKCTKSWLNCAGQQIEGK